MRKGKDTWNVYRSNTHLPGKFKDLDVIIGRWALKYLYLFVYI